MKRIATITFHSSYNYGSNLQAYALQEYIKKICNGNCEYKIINLRTDIQKQMYKTCFEKKGIQNYKRRIVLFAQRKALQKKQQNFEKFINEHLDITKEYSTSDELNSEKFNFDYYISGSDQLWNLQARDFEWANYLEFVKKGKRISYAASFGPKEQTWNEEEKNRVKKDLEEYDFISVREQGSYNNIKELINKDPEINVDPTMLLEKEEWFKIIGEEKILNKDYILLYNLKLNNDTYIIAKQVSELLKMPVIITRFTCKQDLLNNFEKRFDTGPIEFLNLIKNAKLVLSSSFHGTVFSVLFNKPFFAINGSKDFRISTLLEKMNLQDRSIEIDNVEEKCKKAFDISFEGSEKLLAEERKKSEVYLKKALDIE